MTDDIIRMARDAGFSEYETGVDGTMSATQRRRVQRIERFAALVAAHEREACAKVCLETGIKHPQQTGQEACAAAIRARGGE